MAYSVLYVLYWHNFIVILTFSTAFSCFLASLFQYIVQVLFPTSLLMYNKYFIIFWAHCWQWMQHSRLQVNNSGKVSLICQNIENPIWIHNSLFCGNAKVRLCIRFFSTVSLYFLKCAVQNQMYILWVRQLPAIPVNVTYCAIPPQWPHPPFIYTENVLSQKQHIYILINNYNTSFFYIHLYFTEDLFTLFYYHSRKKSKPANRLCHAKTVKEIY
jgi:hypothetical protein